jgi:hypothetical protein
MEINRYYLGYYQHYQWDSYPGIINCQMIEDNQHTQSERPFQSILLLSEFLACAAAALG